MSNPIRIVVPFDIARTAENRTRRLHWAKRSQLFSVAKYTARCAWLAAGSPTASGKVRVSLIVRRARLLDHFNAAGGCKPVLDGIFVGALTPDDSPRWVEIGEVQQERAACWKGCEEVEVVAEEVEPPPDSSNSQGPAYWSQNARWKER